MLINTSCKLVFEDLNNVVENSRRDRDILVGPRDVLDDRYLDR